MKPFRLGVILGRFQHLHLGHEKMIDTALRTCDRVLLLVGSSQESGTRRNPFYLKTRMDLIRDIYHSHIQNGVMILGHIDDMTNEDDISEEWGRYVLNKIDMWRDYYGVTDKVDVMVFGNDEGRMEWFNPSDVVGISQIVLARQSYHISATEIRKYLVKGKQMEWEFYTNTAIHDKFDSLRDELLEIEHYRELAKI